MAAALFLEPGLGKTSIVLAAFKVLKNKGLAKRMIVLAPLKPMSNVWPAQIQEWSDFRHFKFVVLHGPKKEKLLAEALANDVDILITNFDSLNWLFGAESTTGKGRRRKVVVDPARIASLGADVLVVDEISGFKDPGTLRFKILYAARGKFPRFWGLTGSPASNGLMNLFGIMLMTDMGYSLGTYITQFRFKYFTQFGTYVYKPKKGALEEITEACSKTAISMSADDYLTLPELVENDVKVTLPATARAMYDELENAMIVAVGDRKVVASNAAVASGKIRQIASGAVYLTPEPEDPEVVLERLMTNQRRAKRTSEWMHVHDEKLDAIAGILEELNGQPVIVVYEWAHTLARLQARFGEHAAMGGNMKPAECKRVEDLWNANQLPILYGQPAAMAKGLNLQGGNACHIILADMIWDYELYDQLIRRLRRQGNKSTHVFVHRVIADDTVDVRVSKALSDKENVQLAVYDGLKLGKKPR